MVFAKYLFVFTSLFFLGGVPFSSSSFIEEKPATQVENNVLEFVDLGLSVNWAKCNIGALSPEEYGNYYAWGEISTKRIYDWSTYKYCKGSEKTLTKYCEWVNWGYNGFRDNKTILDSVDDAASVYTHGLGRIPTDAEWKELLEYCTWSWSKYKDVEGYKVRSRIPGYTKNWIFLPATGGYSGNSNSALGIDGYYWSSTLSSTQHACNIYFSPQKVKREYERRYHGFSIRCVEAELY